MNTTLKDIVTSASAKEINTMHKFVNRAIASALDSLFVSFIVSVEKSAVTYLQSKGLNTNDWTFGDVRDVDDNLILSLAPIDEEKNIIDVKAAFSALVDKLDAEIDNRLGCASDLSKLANNYVKEVITLISAGLDAPVLDAESARRAELLNNSAFNLYGYEFSGAELLDIALERKESQDLAKASKQEKAKAFKNSLRSALKK